MKSLKKIMISILVIGVCFFLFFSYLVMADETPTFVKPIKLIVPWAAGGGTDIIMRGFMKCVEDVANVKCYTENVTGAQSAVGVYTLMQSRPDGYTIGTLTWDSIATVPFYKLIKGYDLKKLEIVCMVAQNPLTMSVLYDAPWKDLHEFIEYAKKNEVKIADVGKGGVVYLPVFDFEKKTGALVRHISYNEGAARQAEALLSGEVDAAGLSLTKAFQMVKNKQIRVLATTAEERQPILPEVLTYKEQGYDIVWLSPHLIAVPKGTPEERIVALEKVFQEAYKPFEKWAIERGLCPKFLGREEANNLVVNTQKSAFKLLNEIVK